MCPGVAITGIVRGGFKGAGGFGGVSVGQNGNVSGSLGAGLGIGVGASITVTNTVEIFSWAN